jgi:Anti-sigma-K factor rskA
MGGEEMTSMSDTTGSEQQHPDLLGLLRGELTNAQVAAIGGHLESCRECRDELSEVAVGHALLTGAGRTLTTAPPLLALPEAGPLDVRQIRASSRRRWQGPALMLAAAAVLVAGTAGITANFVGSDDPPPVATPTTPAPAQTATLQPIDSSGSGQVLMADAVDDWVEMTVDTKDLPSLPDGQFYYVWLLDPDTNKMLPVGAIGHDGTASFELPVNLISEYSAVDISLEYDDGDPEHSITSVLRAEYA